MRLIDADALYEKLQKDSSYDLDFFDSELREVIETIPTAYDVENVIAELEHQKEICGKDADYWIEKSWKDNCVYNNFDLCNEKEDCFEFAIDIVKGKV